jgi:hypothetical protein
VNPRRVYCIHVMHLWLGLTILTEW